MHHRRRREDKDKDKDMIMILSPDIAEVDFSQERRLSAFANLKRFRLTVLSSYLGVITQLSLVFTTTTPVLLAFPSVVQISKSFDLGHTRDGPLIITCGICRGRQGFPGPPPQNTLEPAPITYLLTIIILLPYTYISPWLYSH